MKGCISQLATVTSTLSFIKTNLNTLTVTVNEMKKRYDVWEGKLVDEGTGSGVVCREIPFHRPQSPLIQKVQEIGVGIGEKID